MLVLGRIILINKGNTFSNPPNSGLGIIIICPYPMVLGFNQLCDVGRWSMAPNNLYICMYVCTYICIYIYTHTRMYMALRMVMLVATTLWQFGAQDPFKMDQQTHVNHVNWLTSSCSRQVKHCQEWRLYSNSCCAWTTQRSSTGGGDVSLILNKFEASLGRWLICLSLE